MESCKKRKPKNVKHSNLSSDGNGTGGSGLNFTHLCKSTAIKDDEVLEKYNDVLVKGLNFILFYFVITYFHIFSR